MATTTEEQAQLSSLIPSVVSSTPVTTAYADANQSYLSAEETLKAIDSNTDNITNSTVINVTVGEETTALSIENSTATDTQVVTDTVAVDSPFRGYSGQTRTVETTAFVNQKVVTDSKPALATFPGSNAIAANSRDVPVSGVPDISPYARSGRNIIGTTTQRRNQKLIHSCDFANDLKKSIYLKKFLKSIARWVREGIRKIMQLMGFSDASGSFSSIINALKKIAKELRYIKTEYIDPIIEFEKYVIAILVKIRAIIQWILSLPAKILALLAACLLKLLKSLVQMFVDAWKESGAELGQTADAGKSFEELSGAIKDAAKAAGELITAGTTAAGLAVGIGVSATVGLVTPVSEAEIAAANKTITNYSGSIPSALEVPSDPDFLKKSIP